MRKEFGSFGEDIACDYLCEHGYEILERNFKNRYGEVDIIAKDGDCLCIVEVKSRQEGDAVAALEAVTASKQRALAKMALLYLQEKDLGDPFMRFDVVGVVFDQRPEPEVILVKNAFAFDH